MKRMLTINIFGVLLLLMLGPHTLLAEPTSTRSCQRAFSDKPAVEGDQNASQLELKLMLASAKGQLGIVKTLLNAGANFDVKDNTGWTALRWASSAGHLEIVKILLDAGADPKITDNKGQDPLTAVLMGLNKETTRSKPNKLEIARLLTRAVF